MSDSENRKRNFLLPSIRCHEEERNKIISKANECGMSIGSYLLYCGLNKKINSKIDKQLIAELSRLGGLQKHLFNESNGVYTKEYGAVLDEIINLIKLIKEKL